MSRKPQAEQEQPPFEENLNRLETVVRRLEESDLALEESLKLFEEGTRLSEACRKQLDEAEQKVEILVKRASGMAAEPLPERPRGGLSGPAEK
jgi:exodeoxyribonuclease VII small subunit